MTALLTAQEGKPAPKPPLIGPAKPTLRIPIAPLTPKDMLRAMVALDQAQRSQPGATVEVIGYDDEATLRLIAVKAMDKVLKEFRPIDGRGHQALYAFMNQNPARPGLGMSVPMLAGGKVTRPDDKWLR